MPLTATQLAAAKTKFLQKFRLSAPQQAGWISVSLADAMTSASRRGHLYQPGLTQGQRDIVRAGWRAQLLTVLAAYVAQGAAPVTQQQFLEDVVALQQFMNATYAACFRTAATVRAGYAPGFRIAHAQKSISLALKHYWCNNVLGEPACCPVDRTILVIAGATQPRWTDLNTIPNYSAKLALLANAAQNDPRGLSLAEWELVSFN